MMRPLLFAGLLLTTFASHLQANPVHILPDDPHLLYSGRWDTSNELGPRASWPATAISITFEGTELDVTLNDNGKNYLQVVLNGETLKVLKLEKGEQTYRVAENLPAGQHHLQLVKRTEASVGIFSFSGFTISEGGKIHPSPPQNRRIEVIGDSISCGYGNEAASQHEKFSATTENAWQTYGAIAARTIGADYTCIAWSGKKLWPDNTIVSLYDRIIPQDNRAPRWDFSSHQPDVIVINLGTNDFNRENPEEEGWVNAYIDFIQTLRTHYPEARIYLAIGTMMSDSWPKGNKALTTIRHYIDQVVAKTHASGDTNVAKIDFGTQAGHHGIGADWHPSVRTHEIMGAKLANAIKQDLGW